MKDELRTYIIKQKSTLSLEARIDASHAIACSVVKLDDWKSAGRVSIYTSLPSEVSTVELVRIATDAHKIVVTPESKSSADLYIVPGLAFDRKGNRLGRGKGYYDRLLSDVKAFYIGLAFEIQMVDNVPHTLYDVPMDIVVTERNIYGKK